MANGICDVCHKRHATHTITVTRNGSERVVELCDTDYADVRGRQPASPFDALFSRFGLPDDFGSFSSKLGSPFPRDRESVSIRAVHL
jgi:ATP-dependent Clp protease ATP-binding subunit ClpC